MADEAVLVTPELVTQMEKFIVMHQRHLAGAAIQGGKTAEQMRRDIRGNEDWLRNAYIQLAQAQKKEAEAAEKAQSISRDVKSQLNFIANYPGVARVQFTRETGRLLIDTDCLDLECPDGTTRRLGSLRIRIETSGNMNIIRRSWGPDMGPLLGRNIGTVTNLPHPHVDPTGIACWGDAAQGVAVFGAEGHYDMLVAQVMEYLKQVNPEDELGLRFKQFPLTADSGAPNWQETRKHDDPEYSHRWCEPQVCDVIHGTNTAEDHAHCEEATCWYLRHNRLGEHNLCQPENCIRSAHAAGTHVRCRPDQCVDARLSFHENGDHSFCLRDQCEVAVRAGDHARGRHTRCLAREGCPTARVREQHENGTHESCRPGRCEGARLNRHDGGRHDYCRPANCEVARGRGEDAGAGEVNDQAGVLRAEDLLGAADPANPAFRYEVYDERGRRL